MKTIKDNTENQETIDLMSIFKSKDKPDDKSYEKALSNGLLFCLQHFSLTTEKSKYDSKAMAILSHTNDFNSELCAEISANKKDFKRKRAKEWLRVISDITNAINTKEMENVGILDKILKRER